MRTVRTAVILAAGMGTRLSTITNDEIPKGLLEINGKTLIERSIQKLKSVGINKIYLVTGHLSECYEKLFKDDKSIIIRKNRRYKASGSMTSLSILKDELNEDFLLLESDLVYEVYALLRTIYHEKQDCILLSGKTNSGDECYVEIKDSNLYKISKDINEVQDVYGELVGISKISNELYKNMIKEYKHFISEFNEEYDFTYTDEFCKKLKKYDYENVIFDVAQYRNIGYLKIEDLAWGEIDNKSQMERVKKYILPRIEGRADSYVKNN